MKKKNLVLILIMILAFLMTACGKDSTSEQKNPTDNNDSTEESKMETEQSYINISAEEAKNLMDTLDSYIILDVRTQAEHDEGHIEGSILIPYDELEEKALGQMTDLNQTILVYCRSGNRSKIASKTLLELGYKDIREFGGIIDWPYEIVK